MTIEKNCFRHGKLEEKDIYVRKNGNKNCRICRREQARIFRYLEYDEIKNIRKCSRCKIDKNIEEFSNHDKKLRTAYCNVCRVLNSQREYYKKRNHLKNRYGITIEEFNHMVEKQNNLCAICNCPETSKSGRNLKECPRVLGVDHCHITGKIRELLCNTCNHILGSAKESIDILKSSIAYLEKHK